MQLAFGIATALVKLDNPPILLTAVPGIKLGRSLEDRITDQCHLFPCGFSLPSLDSALTGGEPGIRIGVVLSIIPRVWSVSAVGM